MTQYNLVVQNNSSSEGDICVYQTDASMSAPNARSVAGSLCAYVGELTTREDQTMAVESTVTFLNPGTMPPTAGYTQAVEVKNCRMLFISGQVALDPQGNVIGEGDLAAQTDQVFKNLSAALVATGAGFEDVVKLTLYVTDIAHMHVVRGVRDLYVNKDRPPASTAVEVSRLVREQFLIEIDAIAAVPCTR